MSIESSLNISRDLARVAEHIGDRAEPSPAFCDRLTRAMTRLWKVGSKVLDGDDVESFDTILVRIAPTASREARLELSESIAAAEAPPRAVLLILAHDSIDIAGPILRLSPALGDDDLCDIAKRCGVAHMGAIAERPTISMRVCDILVLRGNDEVRRIVTANVGAHLSDKAFARLSLQARDDSAVGLVLVGRSDLPDLVVHFLRSNGSVEVRRALIEIEERPRANEITHHIARSIRVTEASWLEPYDFDAASAVLLRLAEVRHNVDPFVRKLAQTDRFAEIVHVLAALSRLPLDLVQHMMVGLDTGPFVALARAVGLKSETVQEILMVGPWLHRLDSRARAAAMLAWTTTDVDEARARVRRWAGEQA